MVDLWWMSKRKRESGAFSSFVNICGAADGHTFFTKSGELVSAISLRPLDAECLDVDATQAVRSVCQSGFRVFDERFTVQSHLLKKSSPALEATLSGSAVVREAIQSRKDFLAAKGVGLYSFDSFLTVAIRPEWKSPRFGDRLSAFGRSPLRSLRRSFGTDARVQGLDAEFERSLGALNQAIRSFLAQTEEHLRGRLLTKKEAFSFFRRLLNPDPAKASAVSLAYDSHTDFFLVDSELEGYRDHLRLDNYFIKVLTLKQLPARTVADMFAALRRVKADLIVTTDWSAIDPTKALADIRSKRRHAHNTKVSIFSQVGSDRPYERELLIDESKESVVADLGELLKAIEMRGIRLGEFCLTVIILALSLQETERAAAEVMKVFGLHDGALNEERYNALNAFLAAMPAGHPYNLRRSIVTNENHADMLSWFQPAEGDRENTFLRAPYLAAFETEDQSLFFYNPHVQDVGHTLVLGPTGSGKSFLMNFFITHAQQYDPYTFIFDVGGSYRWLVALLGGSYIQFRPEERSFSISPFCLEPTPANLEFLFTFTKLLIESDGYRMTDAQERELFEAIRSLYVLDPEQRRLLTLSTTVSRAIGVHLKRWTEGEQYGEWFDNVRDNVTFTRSQCIDFEGMERLGVVLEPLVFYLIHRMNEVIYDPSLLTVFKLSVVDEAWRFLRHPATLAYITEAMRTWRKKNAAMVLATQSLRDLSEVEAFRPVVESCPTKLLLANPTLDAEFYSEVLRLNGVEVEKVRGLAAKRQLLLKRDSYSKVLNLNVDPKSYWLFTTNPYEAKRRQELVNQVGLSAALEILSGGTQ